MNRTLYLIAGVIVAVLAGAGAPGAPDGRAGAQEPIDPANFSPVITNQLFPLSTLGAKSFVGGDTDPDTGETVEERLESRVLPETIVVAGVTVLVLEEKAYVDGELVEVALDYFAQHINGDVYYFGEHVDNYEDGVVANHNGQWLAGENGNQPGIIMAAQPQAGKTYQQELAPGIAEDKATVVSLDETVSTPAGSYTNCIKTRDFTPLEPDVEEFKFHCPGVGLVREESEDGFIELVSIGPAPAAPTPVLTVMSPALTPTPAAGVIGPNTGGGGADSAPSAWGWLPLLAGGAAIAAGTAVRACAQRRGR